VSRSCQKISYNYNQRLNAVVPAASNRYQTGLSCPVEAPINGRAWLDGPVHGRLARRVLDTITGQENVSKRIALTFVVNELIVEIIR